MCCRCRFWTREVDKISLSSSLGSSLFFWTRFLCVRFELGDSRVAAQMIEHKFRENREKVQEEIGNMMKFVSRSIIDGPGMNKDRWYRGTRSYVFTDPFAPYRPYLLCECYSSVTVNRNRRLYLLLFLSMQYFCWTCFRYTPTVRSSALESASTTEKGGGLVPGMNRDAPRY